MKKTGIFNFFGVLAVASSLFFVSCSKEGPAGPAGATGATGATGAAGPNAKFYDFAITFDSASAQVDGSGNLTAYGGNFKVYSGISGVDTAKDLVLLYEKYTSSTSGTSYYTAMPNTSNGLAYNFYYYRNATSTTGGIKIVVSIEDPSDFTINPVNDAGLATYSDNFRAVIIKGMAGKNANVNYSDYNSVKAFYHLND